MPDPLAPDEVLVAAVDLARSALLEVTDEDSIGEPIGHLAEDDHVVSLLFECTMTGYPGWHWVVTLSRVDETGEPTVLETELMPGVGALLAPEWVPWSDRLADQVAADELAALAESSDDDSDDDDSDDDDDDSDDDEPDDDDDDEDGDDSDDDSENGLEFDDDRADYKLDGIDFGEGSAAPELHEGEPADTESEPEDGAPEPPAESLSGDVLVEHEREDKSY